MKIFTPTRRWQFAAAALLFLSINESSQAGGYLVRNAASGNPLKWTGTITLNCDLGALSTTVSNATAKTMVTNAVVRWANSQIPECSLNIVIGGDLGNNNANGNSTAPDYNLVNNGINPVIYDAQGFLTDAIFGVGANQSTLGFAGPVSTSTDIVKGRAVLNGLFIDGAASPTDVTAGAYEGVITHEIGHMLNLTHAQMQISETLDTPGTYAADYTGFPTMFPLVHADTQDLELDDRAWIANLYPSATGLTRTKISGVTRASGGTNLNGVNIVARSAGTGVNDFRNCISCVSGFLDPSATTINGSANEAYYEIPMLGTNTQWVLDCEQLSSGWTGGSSITPLDPPLVLPGKPEFINEPGQESNSDALNRTTTFVTPATNGGSLTGIDLTLNSAGVGNNSVETESGSSPFNASPVSVSAGVTQTVTASISGTEAGIDFTGTDDIEDWFAVSSPVGVEITKITAVPAAGLNINLLVASLDATGGFISPLALDFTAPAGSSEVLEGFYNPTNFGTGSGAGKVYIGIGDGSNISPGAAGDYQLIIESVVSDKGALVVVKPTNVNPTGGSIVITGRNFSNTGGAPAVTFSNAGIQVNSVTFNSTSQITANVTRLAGFVPGSTSDIQVVNQAAGGGYSGRSYNVTAVPVSLSAFSAE